MNLEKDLLESYQNIMLQTDSCASLRDDWNRRAFVHPS